MARTTNPLATPVGGLEFTGTMYTQQLAVRLQAMKDHAAGTVTDADKNGARGEVRKSRRAIQAAGFTVAEWRDLEEVREAAFAASKVRKPRAKKGTAPVEPTADESRMDDEAVAIKS